MIQAEKRLSFIKLIIHFSFKLRNIFPGYRLRARVGFRRRNSKAEEFRRLTTNRRKWRGAGHYAALVRLGPC